jgi:hypothetical protein
VGREGRRGKRRRVCKKERELSLLIFDGVLLIELPMGNWKEGGRVG